MPTIVLPLHTVPTVTTRQDKLRENQLVAPVCPRGVTACVVCEKASGPLQCFNRRRCISCAKEGFANREFGALNFRIRHSYAFGFHINMED